MAKKVVVGPDQKPGPEQLLEMYEKLDGQTKEIKSQFRRGVLTPRHVQALIEHQNPFESVKTAADNAVRLFVDYTRPLAEMLEDGRFGHINSDVTEKSFPITRHPNAEVEMKLFYFNRVIGSDEVIREMDKQGYRPAEFPEGLAYAKANPNEQRKYPIVILGSAWRHFNSDRLVPFLYGWGGSRELGLDWFECGWRSDFRFLAVSKS